MGRKIQAAKASLVAAFLAYGGAAAAGAHAKPAKPTKPTQATAGATVRWGDQLVRFLKLDGFPAYLKIDGFAQLAQFYKPQLVSDATTLYDKYPDQVAGVLELYQKADAGPLRGILIGLETFYKEQNIEPLLDYLKTPGAMDAYLKFEDFFGALQATGAEGKPSAFDFFVKETGIAGDPLQQDPAGGGQIG